MEKQFRLTASVFVPIFLMVILSCSILAQEKTPKPTPAKAQPTPTAAKGVVKITAPEQVADTALFFYSGGRNTLDQLRKTTSERGKMLLTTPGGTQQVNYHRFAIRGETLSKDKIRLDQELPTASFSLVFNDEKTLGSANNVVFTPREDTVNGFEDQIFHSIDALLRYKANESKIELAPNEKHYGVEFYVVDVTDKQGRKTRFFVSAKTFRIMMLTYENNGVRYRRKFYDYNYAQGTLVPFRSVLWADEKQIEETEIGTITFSQKVDEGLFKLT